MNPRKRKIMNTLPIADLSYRPLHEIAMGPLRAALLNCALDFALFDKLTRPVSGRTVADILGTHPGNTRRLLDGLATMDLIEKQAGRYWNSPLADAFLVTRAPTFIGPLLKQTQNPDLNPLDALKQLVSQGPDTANDPADMADETLWAEEVKASAGWVFGGVGQMVAGIIRALPGFSSFRRFLDMGCGHGVFSLYILDCHPELCAVLMDRREVLDAARPLVREFDAGPRVSYLAGDYLTDDLGEGYDLIYASATLNFAKGCIDDLVPRIYDALNPGGYFVSFQDGMIREQTKPDTMLGAVIPSMMMDMDYCFDQGQIADAAVRSGFEWVRSRTLLTPIGEMDLDIGRKKTA